MGCVGRRLPRDGVECACSMSTARVDGVLGVLHSRTCVRNPEQVPRSLVRVSNRFGGRAIAFVRILASLGRPRPFAPVFHHPLCTAPTYPFPFRPSPPCLPLHSTAPSLSSVGRVVCRRIPSDTRTSSPSYVGVSSPPWDPSVRPPVGMGSKGRVRQSCTQVCSDPTEVECITWETSAKRKRRQPRCRT